jgi:hypothetical protein
MAKLLYPQGKSLQYLSERRLGEPKSWSAYCGEEKNLLRLQGIKP